MGLIKRIVVFVTFETHEAKNLFLNTCITIVKMSCNTVGEFCVFWNPGWKIIGANRGKLFMDFHADFEIIVFLIYAPLNKNIGIMILLSHRCLYIVNNMISHAFISTRTLTSKSSLYLILFQTPWKSANV